MVTGMLLGGCSRQHTDDNPTLLRAEALMESHPDSALSILDSLDRSSLRSESDRALYALLLVQARVKNRMDDANDSLIHAAADYYSRTGDSQRKMLAYYNLGFLQSGTDSLSQSVTSLLTALDLAEEIGDNFYASLACRELSTVFRQSCNSPEELYHSKKSYDHICKTNRQNHQDWALYSLAGAYQDNMQYAEAYNIYNQVLDTLRLRPDSLLLTTVYRNLSKSLMAEDKYLVALPYLTNLCTSGYVKIDDYGLLGLCLVKKGDINQAKQMLDRMDPDSPLAHWLKYSIYKSIGDRAMAFEALSDMQDDSENDIRSLMSQRATFSALLHHEQQKLAAREEAKIERMHTVISILIGCLIIIIAIGIIINLRMRQHADNERNGRIARSLQQKLKLQKLEQEASRKSEVTMKVILNQIQHENTDIRNEADKLRETLKCAEARAKELDETIHHSINYQKLLYKQTWEHYHAIGKICSVIYAADPEKKVTTLQMAGWLDTLVDDIAKSPSKFDELETIANMTYDNIMVKLRASDIDFKEDDYRVYLLSIFGLTPAAITKLMKADKIQQVYSRKKRMISKLLKSSNPLSTNFLDLLRDKK